ncbi:aplysianin-A-like [Haliotis rubra]|uniref:aplysianin-A-like n=1 Tax=Haliotis rubra TaxID=36100 RepID=UPI001EE5DB09|nr:aplysianin-A-like [Haliotis rubra]
MKLWLCLSLLPLVTSIWPDPPHDNYEEDCLDVAIIGAGIAGTYTGYRLRNRGLRMAIFEYSDRIGGRMFTAEIPTVTGTTVDFGAMRLKPSEHTYLVNTARQLGLRIVDFPLNFGNPNETVYYLRGRHLRTEELGGPRTPYNLRPQERLKPLDLLWRLYTTYTNMSTDGYPSESEIYRIYTTDGVPLYTITMDEFLARYASREAYNYLHDALVWEHATGRFGALIGLIFLEYGGVDSFADLKTIDNGMDQVPKTLLTRYLLSSLRHSIHLNRQLVAIQGRPGNYKLTFRCTQTVDGYTTPTKYPERHVCARKVVLGVQKDCVEQVNFAPYRLSREFRRQVNAVRPVQAQKIFLAYQYQWWKRGNADITHGRCDLPSDFTYDWRRGTNGYYIHLPSYSDGSASVASWRELQNQGSTIYGSMPGAQRVTTAVRKRIHTYMSRLYRIPEADIPPTVGGAMQLWDTYPYKASWHFFKPGFNMEQTRDYMLKPFPDHDVFHVSGSWWPNKLQSWSEAALRAVDLAVRRYL